MIFGVKLSITTSSPDIASYPKNNRVDSKEFNDNEKPIIGHDKMKFAGWTIVGGIFGGTFAVFTGGLGPLGLGMGISVGAGIVAAARKISSFTSTKILKNGDYAEWAEINSSKPENTLHSSDVTEKSGMILKVINTIEIDKNELTEIFKGFDVDLNNLEGDDLYRLEIFKDDLGPYIGEMKKENVYGIDTQYYPNINDESEDDINDEIEDDINDEIEDDISEKIEDYLVKSIIFDVNKLFENEHAKNNRLQYLGAILFENISAIDFIDKNIANELSNININEASESTDLEIENIFLSVPRNKVKILNQVIILFEKVYKAYPDQLKKLTNTLSLALFGAYSRELLELSSYLIKNGEKISELLPSTR